MGTTAELFQDIIKIDPNIKAIMLSGEALPQEVGEAFRLGYIDYLHKSEVQNLPERVLLQYTRYNIDKFQENVLTEPIYIHKERKFSALLFHTIEYFVQCVEVLNEEYIKEGNWFTIKQVNAGISIEEEDSIEITQRYIHEESTYGELVSKFSVAPKVIDCIKLGVEAKLTENFKETTFSETKSNYKVLRKYNLPLEPTDPQSLYVVSRHYQRAPVYRQLRCILMRHCYCCSSSSPIPLLINQLTSKIATRQIDYFSDGSSKIIETGIENHAGQ